MYEDFYGLREKPFNLTPDPRFLFLSESHRVALEHLLYGITQKEGFMLIVGDVGLGKTTLCRFLMEKLGEDTETALILNPQISEEELLSGILSEFGITSSEIGKKGMVDRLNQFLLEKLASNRKVAVIVDEAQNLSLSVLEQPLSIYVDTYGTGKISDDAIIKLIESNFDLTPKGMIQSLDLLRPIYRKTACYGHFGRTEPEFSWEQTDKAADLKKQAARL